MEFVDFMIVLFYKKKWHILYKKFFLLYFWVGNDVVIGTAVTHPD